ncbi:Protein SCAR2 [Senna tora]|uniref:Protein SCAR2 n=1 Tax=Senna tora TaxID=362788 RepID=A0A835CN76_9FABA|nr:Protein SCAR2 [Senna tora]
MPLARYQIRNEYSLADPELYRAADKDDPEALLEGVAMAGLVGVLRQLGDLAQFAAEIFHDLHEEVMATSARGHGLMARVQQLEAEVPSLEKAFLSQTHHSSFFSNGGTDWHPNLRSEQNLITREDLPRFVMDSYEECRGPPRLFLLDKFDVAGAGACLKRYTDPSFFKVESASSGNGAVEIHREKRIRKVKQKKAARLRNGETPEFLPTHAKLHQLFLEERIENACSNPARLVKLKKRQFNGSAVDAKTRKSYMEKFLESPSPDYKMVCETSIIPLPVKSVSEDTSGTGIKVLDISTVSPVKGSLGNESTCSSPTEQESELKPSSEMERETDGDLVKVQKQMPANVTDEMSYNDMKASTETELAVDGQKKLEANLDGYHSDDATSEVDNYLDALTTMESELETDNECRPKIHRSTDSDGKEEHQLHSQFSYSQSSGDSLTSGEISSFKQDRSDEHIELQSRFSDSQSTGTSSTLDENSTFKRETNEEPMELQAQFSDSQSVGNSSVSEDISVIKKDRSHFSHSDSSGTMVENRELEPKLLPSAKYCEYELEDAPSDHLPQIVESTKPNCNKLVMLDDTQFREEEISDSGIASSSSSLMNSGHIILCSESSDIGANLQPTGSQLVETSDTVELHSSLADDEDGKRLDEPTALLPDSLSIVKDDDFPVISSEIHSLNNLDDGEPSALSAASLQISNDLELAPAVVPTGTQLVETPSDPAVLPSILADDEERKCYVDSVAVVPDTLSVMKDDACLAVASEEHPLNNLDDDDPCGHSGASLQISHDSELAPVIVTTGTQLVKTPLELAELHSILADDGERKSHVDSVAAVPDTISVMKDDACCLAVASKEHPLNNLDDDDPFGHSEAPLEISNDLELAPVILSTGTQLVETPLEPVELNSSLTDDEERNYHVEPIAAVPDSLSVTKVNACPVVSSEEYTLSNLDDSDSHVHSDASLQISNELNLAPEDECSGHSEIKELQAGFSNENCAEILVNGEVSSRGEHTICPFMEEVDSYPATTVPLDGLEVIDSKAEDCNMVSKLDTEDQSSAVEIPPASSLAREQFFCFIHDTPKDEPEPAGVEVLYSDRLSNFEGKSGMEDGDEKSGSTISVEAVEDDDHLKRPSSPGYVGQGSLVNVNDVFTEKVQSEGQAASATPVDSAQICASVVTCPASDLISSSRNLSNLPEPLTGSSDSCQSEMESNEAESTEIFRDFNAEKEKDQLELSSDIIASNIISSSRRDSVCLEESLSSFRDPHAEEMEANEAVSRQSLTELEVQNAVDQQEVASADLGLSLNRAVSCDLPDPETSNSGLDSSLKVQSQCIASANDVTMVPEFSELGTQESEFIQNKSLSSSSFDQLGPETSSEKFLQSQAGQQDLLRVEENSAIEKLHSEHMHLSNQLEQEGSSCAAPESAAEVHLDQSPSSESLSQSVGDEINARHVADSLKPPLADSFPVASDINLGEIPPMPPLPPMQWRRGKVQHASYAPQREVIEVSQASFQPTQPIKTDEKGQFGLLTSERETLQYQNPFLPVMAVEGDKIQYSSGFSVGVSGHPVAVPFQFPFMVNEANGQYNYLVLERSQIQNPFFTLPVVSTGRPAHSYTVASEGEMLQNSNPYPPMPPAGPLYPQEKSTQPKSQQMAETNLEDKALQLSSNNREGEQENPSVTPMPPPSLETVQLNHSLPPWEDEMASSLDLSAQASEFEAEKPNGIPKNKLPRPRNPLIDAVAAHDKSKLRKVTQRDRPETPPRIDERDSLLEQIRTKSFNLKPAVAARPSIQGPKTNLKVAAILEKANAIRQALAGSDDDEDGDSWSE